MSDQTMDDLLAEMTDGTLACEARPYLVAVMLRLIDKEEGKQAARLARVMTCIAKWEEDAKPGGHTQ
jgi:hypothetical protein